MSGCRCSTSYQLMAPETSVDKRSTECLVWRAAWPCLLRGTAVYRIRSCAPIRQEGVEEYWQKVIFSHEACAVSYSSWWPVIGQVSIPNRSRRPRPLTATLAARRNLAGSNGWKERKKECIVSVSGEQTCGVQALEAMERRRPRSIALCDWG